MLITTIFFISVLLGGFISGYISDGFGRKTTVPIVLLASIIITSASVLPSNLYVYTVLRFISGFMLCVS